MPIPTLEWWQKESGKKTKDRKNPLILDIDILLQEYHQKDKTNVQKQKLLILTLYYCTEWLVTESEKNTDFKRPHLTILIRQIEDELRSKAMMQATQERIGGKPSKKLEGDPIEVLHPRDARQQYGLKAHVTCSPKSAGIP